MIGEGIISARLGASKNGSGQGPQVVVTGLEVISNNRQQYFDGVLGVGKTIDSGGTLRLQAGSGADAELIIRNGTLTNNGTIENFGTIYIA